MAKGPEFHEWRPHPSHGLEPGRDLPLFVNAEAAIADYQGLLESR